MKNKLAIKITSLVVSSVITLLLIIFMFVKAFKNDAFSEYGFELDEKYLYYIYACISFTLGLIYNLVYFVKHKEEHDESLNIGISMFFMFLTGYYSKTFFKALNKYGKEGFDSFNMIFMLICLSLTVYFVYKSFVLYYKNKKETENK